MHCICCGAPVESVDLQTLIDRLPPTPSRVVESLSKKPGRFVTANRLADFVYQNDINGGPGYANITISVCIRQALPLIRSLGWDVKTKTGYGGGFMLVHKEPT